MSEREPERRTSTRKKSFLQGRIFFNNRRSAIDCLVRDISAGGAKLIFSQTASIPDVVELFIPQKDQTLRAHVIWRSGEEAGVAFKTAQAPAQPQAPAPAGGDGADLSKRVEQLEAEVAAIRRMLKDVKAVDPEAA
jgi:PilZ domain-containing protein